jgi:hypothetical protein
MTLCIQDPTDPASEYLVDTLLAASNGATRGGGAFAFLSRGGVQLFLRDRGFADFAVAGAFDLVVGVDAITDMAAIAALDAVRADLPSLGASVHIPTHPRSIFHPKFAWFEKPGGGVLVTGSGNLTAGGLRWNVEAFNVSTLNTREIRAVSGQWDAFKAKSAASLFATGDPMVIARLQRNAERRRLERARPPGPRLPRPGEAPPVVPGVLEAEAEAPADVDVLPAVTAQSEVLIAEISKSRVGFDQANFHKEIFFGFFGASTTATRTVYFFHVRADATLGHQEVRPAVSVKSDNHRFELEAAKGVIYPANGRPIGVFVRVASRTFVYALAMPGDAAHGPLTGLLQAARPNPGRLMRQVVFNAAQVRAVWPASPLWQPLTI